MSVHKVPTPPPPHFSTTPLTTENGRGARFVSPTAMQELKARGGILQAASGEIDAASVLGAIAILVATINIAGGFLVTERMLQMFRREGG